MAYSQQSKTELLALKAANPILDIARSLGLEPHHQKIRCLHPERHSHGDRTHSVTISSEKGMFKCWVCPDVKGDVIDLVRMVRGIGFNEAVLFLKERSGFIHFETQSISRPSKPLTPSVPKSVPNTKRFEILNAFLELCEPVSGKAALWLRKHRIFQSTWTKQKLCCVNRYGFITESLKERFSIEELQACGLFNAESHLRFYRHPLILPYFDLLGNPVYLQARALDANVSPKELSLAGSIPCPYNAKLLDDGKGHLFLCEGVIDTLSLLEAGFPAVGIPGASNFKQSWVQMFSNKSVFVAFDADAAGEAGANKTITLLMEGGIEAHRLAIPVGQDINEWLGGTKSNRFGFTKPPIF